MLTLDQINFLNRICPDRWTETNGTIDVKGPVNVAYENFTEIPVQFGKITGSFECSYAFEAQYTNRKMTTLKGAPKEVGEYYACSFNELQNLVNAPEICNDNFFCRANKLTSLEGCPRHIKGSLYCYINSNLHILYGIGRVEGNVRYTNVNDLNEWIIKEAKKNIFVSYADIAKWIKDNNKLKYLLHAQQEIKNYFSAYIINGVELNLYY